MCESVCALSVHIADIKHAELAIKSTEYEASQMTTGRCSFDL